MKEYWVVLTEKVHGYETKECIWKFVNKANATMFSDGIEEALKEVKHNNTLDADYIVTLREVEKK